MNKFLHFVGTITRRIGYWIYNHPKIHILLIVLVMIVVFFLMGDLL